MIIFGFFNSSTSFQGYMNKILGEKFNPIVIVYLDDIHNYSKNADQSHVNTV